MEGKKSLLLSSAEERLSALSAGETASDLANQEVFETEVYPEILRMKEVFIREQLPSIYFPLVDEIKDFVSPMVISTSFFIRYFNTSGTDPTIDIASLAPGSAGLELHKKERKDLTKLWNTDEFQKNTGIFVSSTGYGLGLYYGKRQYDSYMFRYWPENGRKVVAKNNSAEELNKFTEEILKSLKNGDHVKRTDYANNDGPRW